MVHSDLTALKCKPCEGGTPPLTTKEAERFLEKVDGWKIKDGNIQRIFTLRGFKESIKFVNQIAELAEKEGHHPDIKISWNKVTLTLTTHAIHGLSQNDFILAAKINQITINE